jgi:hypothetical protein
MSENFWFGSEMIDVQEDISAKNVLVYRTFVPHLVLLQ